MASSINSRMAATGETCPKIPASLLNRLPSHEHQEDWATDEHFTWTSADRGVGEGLSPDDEENQVWTSTPNKRRRQHKENLICSSGGSLGDWTIKCLDERQSLVKNFERTLSHATTKINLCFVRLYKRLVPSWDLKWVLQLQQLSRSFRPLCSRNQRIELEDIWTLPGWNTGDLNDVVTADRIRTASPQYDLLRWLNKSCALAGSKLPTDLGKANA